MLVLLAVVVVVVVTIAIVFGRASGDMRTARSAKRVATVLLIGSLLLLVAGFTQFRLLRSGPAGTVVLAIDVSESMSRDDVAPTRIQAAKAAARDFLGDVPSEVAVGLVAFAGTAQTLAEPTTRSSVVEQALVGLPRGEGTVIGDGLDTSLDDISQAWAAEGRGPAAVVLLSDGRDTGSTISPEAAAQRAKVLGVPVYTVVLAPTTSGEATQNIDLMSSVARTSGGEEFTATTANGLLDVYRTIQDRLTTALAITNFGAWFVGAAGALAVAATIALLLAIRAENAPARATARPPVRRDVPRSRRPRTGRGRAARPPR